MHTFNIYKIDPVCAQPSSLNYSCGLYNFKGIKLCFECQYWVGDVSDEEADLYQITDLYQIMLNAQAAALNKLKPGVLAEEVHNAAANFY